MVETEKGMVAGAPEMTVVCRALLAPIGLAHGAVHIQHDPLHGCPLPKAVYPFPGKAHQCGLVLGVREDLGLEPTHLAFRGCCMVDRAAPDHLAHGRIDGEPLGVVRVLVSGKPAEHRLSQL